MKATLEFNLPEEASDHMDAVKGWAWKALVFDFDQQLRSWVKYGTPDGKPMSVGDVRDALHAALNDADLSLD